MAEREEFLRHMEGKKMESQQAFTEKALLRFCKLMQIDARTAKYSPEFGFGWLHKEYPSLPIKMDAAKIKPVDFEGLIKGMTRTEAWTTYFQLLDETSHTHMGLILQVGGLGLYVMHNVWGMRATPGHTRLLRVHAGTDEKGIIFESVEAFCESLSLRWKP